MSRSERERVDGALSTAVRGELHVAHAGVRAIGTTCIGTCRCIAFIANYTVFGARESVAFLRFELSTANFATMLGGLKCAGAGRHTDNSGSGRTSLTTDRPLIPGRNFFAVYRTGVGIASTGHREIRTHDCGENGFRSTCCVIKGARVTVNSFNRLRAKADSASTSTSFGTGAPLTPFTDLAVDWTGTVVAAQDLGRSATSLAAVKWLCE